MAVDILSIRIAWYYGSISARPFLPLNLRVLRASSALQEFSSVASIPYGCWTATENDTQDDEEHNDVRTTEPIVACPYRRNFSFWR